LGKARAGQRRCQYDQRHDRGRVAARCPPQAIAAHRRQPPSDSPDPVPKTLSQTLRSLREAVSGIDLFGEPSIESGAGHRSRPSVTLPPYLATTDSRPAMPLDRARYVVALSGSGKGFSQ